MLLKLVTLICCIAAALACLQCDKEVRDMHEDFIQSAPSIQEQLAFQSIIEEAQKKFDKTSQKWKGIIAPGTLYRAKTEYRNEFYKFLEKKVQNIDLLFHQLILVVEKGNNVLAQHLSSEGLCDNGCVIPQAAMAGEFAKIDCNQPWHKFVFEKHVYDFSFAPGTTRDFTPLIRKSKPFVVLNMISQRNQGTYQCSLQSEKGTIYYQLEFILRVTPRPPDPLRPRLSLPALPLPRTNLKFMWPNITVTCALVGTLAVNVLLLVVLWYGVRARRREYP